jgi:hypothetical protein
VRGRYLLLAAVVVIAALALTALGRARRPGSPSPVAAEAPTVVLAIAIDAGGVSPATTSVPKGVRVRLSVEQRGDRPLRLSLAGYQDRLDIPPLAPGTRWSGEFLADRPGEDFAWLVDGQPVGRLVVTGSHLVEGHR